MEGAVMWLLCLAFGILQVLGKPGGRAPYFLDSQCAKETHFRVINGQNADILYNPWMAQIIDGGFMICGGSLISNRYVLTAAHCRSPTNQALRVRLGDYNIRTTFDCTAQGCIPRPQDYGVTHVFTYRPYVDYHNYDLALLRLSGTVTYGVHIRPVCLLMAADGNILHSIASFNVTGWGRTGHAQVSFPLQQTTLMQYDKRHCIRAFGRQLDHTHICAGRTTSFTCNGDSGGPLTAKLSGMDGNPIVLFGLVSYGFQRCDGPTVFTNVLPYLSWVRWHIVNYP